MPYDTGDRMRLSYSLSARDRRRMSAQISSIQEEIEALEEKRNKLMAEHWSKGLPLSTIQGAAGLGYSTVRSLLKEQGLDIDPA